MCCSLPLIVFCVDCLIVCVCALLGGPHKAIPLQPHANDPRQWLHHPLLTQPCALPRHKGLCLSEQCPLGLWGCSSIWLVLLLLLFCRPLGARLGPHFPTIYGYLLHHGLGNPTCQPMLLRGAQCKFSQREEHLPWCGVHKDTRKPGPFLHKGPSIHIP